MVNFSPLGGTVSFDDLLKANKQQFDRIFSAQTKELGLLGSSHRPPTTADLASASLASEAATQPSDVYAMLNDRFGSQWSSEVVEHKTERGSVTVLVMLPNADEPNEPLGCENSGVLKILKISARNSMSVSPRNVVCFTSAKSRSR